MSGVKARLCSGQQRSCIDLKSDVLVSGIEQEDERNDRVTSALVASLSVHRRAHSLQCKKHSHARGRSYE